MTSTSTFDVDKLPTIPKDWNLTDNQKASMIATQKKNIALDRGAALQQKDQLKQFMQHSAMTPPVYPILVVVKQNNVIRSKYYLTDNTQSYLYAANFDDATSKVKSELTNPSSQIQKDFASDNPGSNKLRISSDNIKSPTKIGNFSIIPNSNYKYWEIITTNAATSFFSSLRQSMRGGRRRMKKNKKSKKSKKHRKTKRRMR